MIQPFFYCSHCGELDIEQTRVETRAQSGKVRGEEITVEMPLRLCNICDEELNDSELDNAMMIATYDVYRKSHNLIFPADIVALREKYDLSQKNLALLLGLGEITVHRYETGALAEEAPSKLLRLMETPANMERMLTESGDKIPASALAKLQKRLASLQGASSPRAKKGASLADDLDARLAVFGLKPNGVKALKRLILPPELQTRASNDTEARGETERHWAQNLFLETANLRDPNAPLAFSSAVSGYFKSRRDAPSSVEILVGALGTRLAQLVAAAFGATPVSPSARSAASIRAEILATGVPWVGLPELLEWSWNHGLPVVKATLPDGLKRWDGMALRPAPLEKPVALSFCSNCRPSWQAFIVAHELGHHFLGHVTPDAPELDEGTGGATERKEREIAANAFALELLTDNIVNSTPFGGWHWDTPPVFADKIRPFATQHKIHPGVMAFQLFRQVPTRKGLCMDAAKILDAEEAAPIFESFYSRLDTSAWNAEDTALFQRFTATAK